MEKKLSGNLKKTGKYFDDLISDCYLVHFISNDFALGAGIAKQIEIRYQIKQYLKDNYYQRSFLFPDVFYLKMFFNLVTKEFYWNKPTYKDLSVALMDLSSQVHILEIKELHMPKIGCGMDKLDWIKLKELLRNTFQEEDIKIIVYHIS